MKFQFHYGTIKRLNRGGGWLRIGHFNSTMVRLKDEQARGLLLGSEFQFHYGTIKSLRRYEYNYYNEEFQFHYGTIKSFALPVCLYGGFISIPLWYD